MRPIAHTAFYVMAAATLFFWAAIPAYGAPTGSMRAYFSVSTTTVPVGADVPVGVFIDATLPVNGYIVTVTYPPTMLDFVTADNSRSLIDVWQTTPLLSASAISFKGGSIAPFKGFQGELFTFVFHAKSTGDATFNFQNISLYLANGKGTKVIPQPGDLTLHVVPAGTVAPQNSGYLDHVPPEIKYLAFIANPYDTQAKLLGFQVADPGSGIKQIYLRTRKFFWWSDFGQAINPTALPKSVWMAQLRVVDNAGNTSDGIIYDWNAFARGPLFLGGTLLVLFFLGAYFIRRRIVQRRSPQ